MKRLFKEEKMILAAAFSVFNKTGVVAAVFRLIMFYKCILICL